MNGTGYHRDADHGPEIWMVTSGDGDEVDAEVGYTIDIQRWYHFLWEADLSEDGEVLGQQAEDLATQ